MTWPVMGYYAWLDWCEENRAERDTVRVFIGQKKCPVEWHLGTRRWDGQPPLDAWVRVPLWALEIAWRKAYPQTTRVVAGAPPERETP